MKSIAAFNALNGATVSRAEIEKIINTAKTEEQFEVATRLQPLLAFSDDLFKIEVEEPEFEVAPVSILDCLDCETHEDHEQGLGKAVTPNEVYDMITQKIVAMIATTNSNEYKKAWKNNVYGKGYTIAFNFVSKKRYRGINAVLLSGFKPILNPFYLTFKQVQDLGGSVKKGAQGHEVVYYTKIWKAHNAKENKKFSHYNKAKVVSFAQDNGIGVDTLTYFPILKYYNVFNGTDIEGIDFDLQNFKTGFIDKELPAIEESKLPFAEAIIDNYPNPKPAIIYGGNTASFTPEIDEIRMPHIADFDTIQDYYRTMFHELSHSTGTPSRLNRVLQVRDRKLYNVEELIAEMGAVFLSAEAGIIWHTNKNHAAYLKGYNNALTEIKNDNKFIFKAATQAQKIADYILQFDANGQPLYLKNLKINGKIELAKPQKKSTKKVVAVIKTVKKPLKKVAKIAKVATVIKPRIPAVKKVAKATPYYTPKPTEQGKNAVVNMPISKIFIDKKRFQNREQLNDNVVQNIISNFDATKFDAIIVWHDDIEKKYFILAGHHRFEAIKQLKHKNIATKIANYTEAQAKHYAIVESNSNRTLEQPQERAKVYRNMLKSGSTKAQALVEANKNEGKNGNYIFNLAQLDPNGMVIQAIKQLGHTPDKQNATILEKITDWIGEARRKDLLTNAHEKEMFDFLNDKEQSKRFTTKAEFLQKIYALISDLYFEKNQPLNLKRLQYKTDGEAVYDAEYNTLKARIESIVENKQNLIERFKNPMAKGYVDPKSDDYNQVVKSFDVAIANLNNDLKAAQSKLLELSRKKSHYTSAGNNQVGLFGKAKPLNAPNEFINKNSLAYKRLQPQAAFEYYKIEDKDISEFLGNIEKKTKESVVITLAGGQGSMKTRMLFRLMAAFAKNYKCGHASIEEHPDSALYASKVDQYISDPQALHNITAPEVNSIVALQQLIEQNEVIFIDSFAKLQEIDSRFEVDKDLRKKYNGKLFVVIFQQTTDGKMRGGSKSQFDGDVILMTNAFADYRQNYVFANKNRYQNKPLDGLHYTIFDGKLIQPEPQPAPQEKHVFSFKTIQTN